MPAAFEALLHFMYADALEVELDSIVDVLRYPSPASLLPLGSLLPMQAGGLVRLRPSLLPLPHMDEGSAEH